MAWLLERGIDRSGASGGGRGIRDHEVELMDRMFALLQPDGHGRCRGAPGLRLLGPLDVDKRVGVFSFVHDDLSSQEMAAILEASYGILTRAGLHCAPLVHEMMGTSPVNGTGSGALRLSFGPFLTLADVDYACSSLGAICREQVAAATTRV